MEEGPTSADARAPVTFLERLLTRNQSFQAAFPRGISFIQESTMGRGLLLWLIGVPIPVILLLWLFFGR
jgi:hypothetical protein